MYGLSTEDLDLQTRARAFADELIPHEARGRTKRRRPAPGS